MPSRLHPARQRRMLGGMTPVELARQECANYNQGACLGVSPDSLAARDDQPMNAHPLPECVLYLGQPCAYFERCVLPMANRGKPELIQAREISTAPIPWPPPCAPPSAPPAARRAPRASGSASPAPASTARTQPASRCASDGWHVSS